jgi:hypothetical protein
LSKNNLRRPFSSPIFLPPKNMTKKHFIAAANLIQSEPDLHKRANLAHFFCELARADNPKFNESKFLDACGL